MTIGVYGIGRFGSFWAETIRENTDPSSVRVVATSRSPKPGIPGVDFLSEEEFFATSDMVFFCVAISSFKSVLERVAPMIRDDCLILDTCSVKAEPAAWMRGALEDSGCQIIATHPMFGPDSARNGLAGLPVVVCQVRAGEDRISEISSMFSSWGLKVLRMTPLEHDKEAAYSQGVTHFVGRVLSAMDLHDTEIATQGYKALMTIADQTCNDPMQLFIDLQRHNPYAREMRLSLQVAVEKVLNKLRESEE